VDSSFEDAHDMESDNYILKADAEWGMEHNLNYHPSITINNITYRGDVRG
jgi:hypothetical protein